MGLRRRVGVAVGAAAAGDAEGEGEQARAVWRHVAAADVEVAEGAEAVAAARSRMQVPCMPQLEPEFLYFYLTLLTATMAGFVYAARTTLGAELDIQDHLHSSHATFPIAACVARVLGIYAPGAAPSGRD
ncbi:hypothetical protein AcW1_006385 [Taiwanofungus camphoratus]|nr:hypothetical protein AcW1_006385 [Antrodia cinnamomea]